MASDRALAAETDVPRRPRPAIRRPGLLERAVAHPLASVVYRAMLGASLRMGDAAARRAARCMLAVLLRQTREMRIGNMRQFFRSCGWTRASCLDLDQRYLTFHARLFVESVRLLTLTPAELSAMVSLEGETHLREALARGRGVQLVGAHLGNWLYMPTRLAAAGYATSSIAYEVPISGIEQHLQRVAWRHGISVVHTGHGSARFVKRALDANRVVLFLFDASVRPDMNVWLPFGDSSMRVDPGPARLALMFGAPVLTIQCEALPSGARVSIAPPPPAREPGERSDRPRALMESWLAHLHGAVSRRPEQWLTWTHTRLADPSWSEAGPPPRGTRATA